MTKTNHVKKTALLLGAVLAAVLLALSVTAGPSGAAFPGQNGKIVLYRNGDIWSMNADGSGSTQLTTNYNAEYNPAVSPTARASPTSSSAASG